MTPDELAAAKAEQIKMDALDAWEACDHQCLKHTGDEDSIAFDLRYQAFVQGYIAGRAALDAEIDRLRAVVERLPKTADGVPVTPGMNLYNTNIDYDFGAVSVADEDEGALWCRDVRGIEFRMIAGHCYSTRALAESAAKGGV